MQNFKQEPHTLTVTLPYACTSGQAVMVGKIFGVATRPGALGDQVDIKIGGVYSLPCVSAQSFLAGTELFWDDSARTLTSVSGAMSVGVAAAAKAVGVSAAEVKLREQANDGFGSSLSLTSGQWYSVPAFCQITLAGTGSYSYSTRNAAGTVTAGGSGTCPDTVPVYMGSDTQISVTFPATATAKVN